MSDVTRMLKALEEGRSEEAEALLQAVYSELKKIAIARMAQEAPGHTLQPTALVHEAWMRMFGNQDPSFQGRAHFFAAAAEAMRRVLVESARRRRSLKRGGGAQRVELQDYQLFQELRSDELLAVDESLHLLAAKDPVAAELVKLKYFVGMKMEEVAATLGLSLRNAERIWAYARAWLRRNMKHQSTTV